MKRYTANIEPPRMLFKETSAGQWVLWSDVLKAITPAAGIAARRLVDEGLIVLGQHTDTDVQEVIEAAIREVIEGE